MIKKFPWGISIGVCAMVLTFLTIAIIALNVVSSVMYVEVGSDDGLITSWYVYLIYVLEALFVVGLVASTVFYILLRVKKPEKVEEVTNEENL